MYGYKAAEAVGEHLSLIAPAHVHEQVEAALERVRTGTRVQRVETVRRCKNGTHIEVALTIAPVIDGAGRVVGACSVARDITEQRWLASQLDATLVALESALDQARASEAATRRFLDDAAHQLRSPITTIRASAEMLLRSTDDRTRERLLAALVGQSATASRLMAGLLQMARLNHAPQLVRQPCDLTDLCRRAAERVSSITPGLDVTVEAGEGSGDKADVDPNAVSEILSNLLENAARHAKSRIGMSVARSDRWHQVTVSDDGSGVPPDAVERIFERFVSLDRRGGSGLGLPIARALAEAHGGELQYEEGFFVVRLPAGP